MKRKLIVIDISNFIFRAFYAIRPLHSPKGVPVNAIHGVTSMLLKLLSDYRPSHVVLARDSRGDSFREEIYPEYKANRDDPPEDLVPQFALIEELIKKMNLPAIMIERHEADDVIGTVVTKWRADFDEIFVATSDKDILQFVDEKVKVLDTMKDKIFGPNEVFEKMGVWPNQVVDYLSMVGDSSDNVPGLPGVGEKGAAKLLLEYKTVEECLKNVDKINNKRVKEAFLNHLDKLELSKKLVAIVTDLDLPFSSDQALYRFSPSGELVNFLKDLGLKQMAAKILELSFGESLAVPVAEKELPVTSISAVDLNVTFDELDFNAKAIFVTSIVSNKNLLGIAIFDGKKGSYLPVDHDGGMLTTSANTSKSDLEKFLNSFAHYRGEVVTDDSSPILWSLLKKNLHPHFEIFETAQVGFVIEAGTPNNLSFLVERFLSVKYEESEIKSDIMAQEGKNIAGRRVWALTELYPSLLKEIENRGLSKIYRDIDAPLAPILAQMEVYGVRINIPFLKSLESEFGEALLKIEEEIEKISGEKINLKSPKQVSVLLFDKLGLPIIRKTKTGASTDSDVLEELSLQGASEVPDLILKYRELDKLLSTYVRVLPTMVDPQTNRLHTRFHQNVAATGRLSSESPNLQNIPVRSENGRKIRKAFVAKPGHLLLSADYSQVELRLLAHFSGDQTMIKAFLNGEDIHRQTAAEIMEIPLKNVTDDDRARAKAVNFGLMYGQSSFGLSNQLKIGRKEARDFIELYFKRFHTVKAFLDSLKEFAEEHGYVETMHGRRRYLPEIRSTNRVIKSNAERVAINSPIQGSAADIIKLAMIAIDKEMKSQKLKSLMLLQVHDELIFEVPENELSIMQKIVKEKMEGVVSLKVPLSVEVGFGVNWLDL